jgi:hypothetical protein
MMSLCVACLQIKLVQAEASSHDLRARYVDDYRAMCDFGRSVSFKVCQGHLDCVVLQGSGSSDGSLACRRWTSLGEWAAAWTASGRSSR